MRNTTTKTDGPYPKTYKRAGDMLLERSSAIALHLKILACVRRMGIDKGLEPVEVEASLAEEHLATFRLATSRLFGEPVPMLSYRIEGDLLVHGVELGELRRVAAFLTARVKRDHPARFERYPDGWRAQIFGEKPAPAREREPGDDDA